MPRKTAAERQKQYRERLKLQNPEKYKELQQKTAARALEYYRKKQRGLTEEHKGEQRIYRKRRRAELPALDESLLGWFEQCRDKNLTGTILRKKTQEFSKSLGDRFRASNNGWLGNFKRPCELEERNEGAEDVEQEILVKQEVMVAEDPLSDDSSTMLLAAEEINEDTDVKREDVVEGHTAQEPPSDDSSTMSTAHEESTAVASLSHHIRRGGRVRALDQGGCKEMLALTVQRERVRAEEARRDREEARRDREEARRDREEAQCEREEARRDREEARREREEARRKYEEARQDRLRKRLEARLDRRKIYRVLRQQVQQTQRLGDLLERFLQRPP